MGSTAYKNAPTKTVDVGGTKFAYRQLGAESGVPVIFLTHLAAVLDNWDPRVVDGIAAKHRVITFDNRAKQFLFFTRTANGKRAGKQFLARLKERTANRDTPISIASYYAQLKACYNWGKQQPHDLSKIAHPVLVANGDNDRMLPTPNTLDLARRLPNNELVIYPDAGHGGIFQYHEAFVSEALKFLRS